MVTGSRSRVARALAYDAATRYVNAHTRSFRTTRFLSREASPQKPTSKLDIPPTPPTPKAVIPPNPSRPAPDRQIGPERLRQGFVAKRIGAPIGHAKAPRATDDWTAEENKRGMEVVKKRFNKTWVKDIRNMDINRGKFYLANDKLYAKGAACYFPNVLGRSLNGVSGASSTAVLQNNVSIVVVYSRQWASEQVQTFVGKEQNPEVAELLEAGKRDGSVQLVEINHEETLLSSWVLKAFEWSLRRTRDREQQRRYFTVRNLPWTVKESLVMMNEKVGHVFLVDKDCKIRWSACADALPEEKEMLAKSLRKLSLERSS